MCLTGIVVEDAIKNSSIAISCIENVYIKLSECCF